MKRIAILVSALAALAFFAIPLNASAASRHHASNTSSATLTVSSAGPDQPIDVTATGLVPGAQYDVLVQPQHVRVTPDLLVADSSGSLVDNLRYCSSGTIFKISVSAVGGSVVASTSGVYC